MKYKFETLNCGAKLVYTKNTITKTTKVEVEFDCGAREDTIPGLAHFCEHMFFTGTKTMNKEQVSKKYFDFIDANAVTGRKSITFTGNIFTKELENYLNTVATLITESTFTQENVDKEIKVVQQEIAGRADDSRAKAYMFTDYNLSKHPVFKNGVLGNKKSVASIKSKDVKNFVNKYFVLNNMFVYVVSPLNYGEVKKIVENTLVKKLRTDENVPKLPLYAGYANNDHFFAIKTKEINKCYLDICFVSNLKETDIEKRQHLWLANQIMNDMSEGIGNQLRLKKSLVYYSYFFSNFTDKDCVVKLTTECDKENIDEIIKTVAEYLKNISKTGFNQAQLDKQKRELKYMFDSEEPSVAKLKSMLADCKYVGRVLQEKELRKILMDTTLDEVNQVFKEVYSNPKVSLAIYGEAKKSDVMDKQEFFDLFKM